MPRRSSLTVVPAQAGTHIPESVVMGPRLRGDDTMDGGRSMSVIASLLRRRHLRAVRQRHAARRPDRQQSKRAVRSAPVHLARLLVELRRRRLHPDGATGRGGDDDRRGPPPRRSAAGARRHRRGRARCRRAENPARRARAQHQAGAGLSRHALDLSCGRARRGRRPHLRFLLGQGQPAAMARTARRLPRARAVRARGAPSPSCRTFRPRANSPPTTPRAP